MGDLTRFAGEMVWCEERTWLQHSHCSPFTCNCNVVRAYGVFSVCQTCYGQTTFPDCCEECGFCAPASA